MSLTRPRGTSGTQGGILFINLHWYGTVRRLAWPSACSSIPSFLRSVADACELVPEAAEHFSFHQVKPINTHNVSAMHLSILPGERASEAMKIDPGHASQGAPSISAVSNTYVRSDGSGRSVSVLVPVEAILEGQYMDVLVTLDDEAVDIFLQKSYAASKQLVEILTPLHPPPSPQQTKSGKNEPSSPSALAMLVGGGRKSLFSSSVSPSPSFDARKSSSKKWYNPPPTPSTPLPSHSLFSLATIVKIFEPPPLILSPSSSSSSLPSASASASSSTSSSSPSSHRYIGIPSFDNDDNSDSESDSEGIDEEGRSDSIKADKDLTSRVIVSSNSNPLVTSTSILVTDTSTRKSRDKGHIRFSEDDMDIAEMGIASKNTEAGQRQMIRRGSRSRRSGGGDQSSAKKSSGVSSGFYDNDDEHGEDEGENDMPDLTSAVASQQEFKGPTFQKQIIKFQRILTHLVNERTVLAWFRVCLSFITIAIKFMKLGQVYMDHNTKVTSILVLICGGLYVFILPHTWYTGFQRYLRCKEMIDFDMNQLSSYLHKMGFNADIASLASLIGLSFISLCVSGSYIIWMSSGTHSYI